MSTANTVFAETEHLRRVFRAIPGGRSLDFTDRSIEETSHCIARNAL